MKLFIFLTFLFPLYSIYNISYLRSLEKIYEEEVINKYVNIGLNQIENMMLSYAKNGYNEISVNDCDFRYNLIDYDLTKYNDLTPKDYNYLKPIIIEKIEEKIKSELCNDCILNKRKINNCIKYTLLW